MRLASWEVKEIKKTAKKIFGEDTKVYLFGSRVDNTKKGGDIDYMLLQKIILMKMRLNFGVNFNKDLVNKKLILL